MYLLNYLTTSSRVAFASKNLIKILNFNIVIYCTWGSLIMPAAYFSYVNLVTKQRPVSKFDPCIDHLGHLCSIARGYNVKHQQLAHSVLLLAISSLQRENINTLGKSAFMTYETILHSNIEVVSYQDLLIGRLICIYIK